MQTENLIQSRIQQLDNRLANQIAAGEVVERPASVVKELLENAIDAGASRIEVDIERGGTRLIRVTDNGCGICKEDLELALARHATSKIACSDDLGAINSLGFRGEALASIASVSRLVLTSRTSDAEFAWQAIAEGRNMSVKVQPASATVGTRIEVRDLFYNTPARQKFLRAEKTEFSHIEEIFKRHALANHSTAFILKHNHKVVRRIPAVNLSTNMLSRIEAICGKPFAEHALPFNCQHELVNLKGWTGGTAYHRSESDIQYVFVNNRPVKDKMLNHAIRQAFQDQLPVGRMPTFVMFIEIDPASIDVNVHPTKHEIRFDHQRMIHDLIVHSIMESLSENQLPLVSQEEDKVCSTRLYPNTRSNSSGREQQAGVGYSQVRYNHQTGSSNQESIIENKLDEIFNSNKFSKLNQSAASQTKLKAKSDLTDQSFSEGSLTNVIDQNYLLINRSNQWFIVDSYGYLKEWLSSQIDAQQKLATQPLLFPKEVSIDCSWLEQLEVVELLQRLGFYFSPKDAQMIMLMKAPKWLQQLSNERVTSLLVAWAEILSKYFQSEPQANDLESVVLEMAQPLASNSVKIVDTIFSLETVLSDSLTDKTSVVALNTATIAAMFK